MPSFNWKTACITVAAIVSVAVSATCGHAAATRPSAPPQLDTLFLGPKGETGKLLHDLLLSITQDQVKWRQGFHTDDPPLVNPLTLSTPEATVTRASLKQQLSILSSRLQDNSNPWFSPRYMGHMNSDLLLPAVAGYFSAMLYNANNVVYEGGPATTEIELEVATQLAGLAGYDPAKSWGNITAGGSTANFQALWYARNLKSLPLAVKEVMPELVKGKSAHQLMNMSVAQTIELLDRVKSGTKYETVLRQTVKGVGVDPSKLGKLLVPQSRHYSWDKSADILGIGSRNIIAIPVDRNYRMDVEILDRTIADLARRKIPILAVVSVLGTTEEGAVDETHRIAALRRKYAERGTGFFYHIDAAYGGYIRSMFINPSGNFMTLDEIRKTAVDKYGIPASYGWPDASVYEAFKAVPEADSITIDPHKLGYIPYPAGALLFRDKRILAVQTFHAAYVQDLRKKAPVSIGQYTIEGSKPGAAAAAVWTAHQVLPLNSDGYGRLLGRTIKSTAMLYSRLSAMQPFKTASGKSYRIITLVKPDTNIVDYVVKEEGNQSLAGMNSLNQRIYDNCSYVTGNLMKKDLILSKTVFSPADYGNVPLDFVRRCGLADAEWKKTQSVLVLRSTMMSPFLADEEAFGKYFNIMIDSLKKAIEKVER